ncbi:MAG TPA: hypothetical protein VGP76_08525 [Planctomycetaceae bacterium]|nr:hypothetical protein [Planctomycetaceae bacterium]
MKEAAIADQGMQRRLTAAAPVVERLFRLCGKGIGLGDSHGGRQNVRFATSLRVLAGGLILIPLLGGGVFLLGDTPLSILLFLLFVLRHWLVSRNVTCPLIGVSLTSDARGKYVGAVAL